MIKIKNSILYLSLICISLSILYFIIISLYKDHHNEIYYSNIAVIDSVKLKKNALCFKTHDQIAKNLSNVMDRMRKSEMDIKKEYDDLKNRKKLSKKERKLELERIENKWNTLSSKYNDEIHDIKNLDLKLSDFLQKKIHDVIKNIAYEKNIQIVLNSQIQNNIVVFFMSKSIDITDLVVRKLNEVQPNVNLSELK